MWAIVEPLVPEFAPRRQGGGTAPLEGRAVFTAIVYVLTSGCAWRHLPGEFGVSVPTARRRFTAWTRAGLWPRLHHAVLDELGACG
ncbi:transposase [Actinomadura madurae]|uniref:transposase n=1 Tax=Actinomadura madurae TaxID=1993 RepID=UPI0020D22D7A|nr:transposase [Actinomadura madurae]MCP9982826.1 transposase [Actinomadura madurae]MCQ0005625.1 transposase [Actinomadura madurae]MCQ0019061.1 transposase [Actinomadura madurae]